MPYQTRISKTSGKRLNSDNSAPQINVKETQTMWLFVLHENYEISVDQSQRHSKKLTIKWFTRRKHFKRFLPG